MEKIKILKFSNTEKKSYESIIPYYQIKKNNNDDYGEQWPNLLMHYLSNGLAFNSMKINDIKLILFEKEIVVIVDDKNCIIVFNIEKFKLFLKRKKFYTQGLNCKFCEPLLKKKCLKEKMSNKCSSCGGVKTHIMDSYKNSYIIIESKKFNINIVKINFIESSSKCDKLILLTESNEIYIVEIGIPYFYESKFSLLQLLYKNIDYYHIFSKKILFRQIKNNIESYSLIRVKLLGTKKVTDELLSQKIKLDITGRNVITHIFTQYDKKYKIESIDDKFMSHYLTLDTEFHAKQVKCTESSYSISTSDKTNLLTNGFMISDPPASNKQGLRKRCVENVYIIYISICSNYNHFSSEKYIKICVNSIITHDLIMNDCYYVIRLQDHIIFFLSQHGIMIYNRKFYIFIDHGKDIDIIHYNQLKTNELINWRQPYLHLNDIIKNENLKNMLVGLILYIKSKINYYVPILCWEIIFSYTKEYDFLNVLILTTKKKRELENVLNLTNKKQKIK